MKSNGLRLLRGLLLLAVLPACAAACTITARAPGLEVWVDEGHHPRAYDYYYYPDVEVYFDPVPRLWFWFEGGYWVSGPRLPGYIVIHGRRERFRTDADRPYVVHQRVFEHYHPGDRGGPSMGRPEDRPGPPMDRPGARPGPPEGRGRGNRGR